MVVVPIIPERATDSEPEQVRAGGPSLLEVGIRPRRLNPVINNPSSIINRRAFTLIELLVVIAIISLLMAVLLPALQRVRSQAKAVACQARLRQWGVMLYMFAHDNDGSLPILGLSRGTSGGLSEFHITNTDINLNKLIFCPMATRAELRPDHQFTVRRAEMLDYVGGKSTAWWSRTTYPDSSQAPLEVSGSYGFNGHIYERVPYPQNTFSIDKYPGSPRNNLPIYLDCAWEDAVPRQSEDPPAYEDDISSGPTSPNMKYFCLNRHNGGVNGLFLDWSVRKVGLKELWTLKWDPKFDTANAWTKAGGVQPEDWPQWMRRFKDY